jgi:3'(2'), 5'-bisphosphate nucleotidase
MASALVLAQVAGEHILDIYNSGDLHVEYKNDQSPLTLADKKSHDLLVAGLNQISELPILSEEGADIPWDERKTWRQYWLLDPLDGTKEFIKRNGEFTVNVALIADGLPVLGVVHVPVARVTYYGAAGLGAFKQINGESVPLQVSPPPTASQRWRLVGSRSHDSAAFTAFVQQFTQPDVRVFGSSLKTCKVAEGEADLYPRFGPTYEWDTAAAHAVVAAAGGRVIDYATKQDLRYNAKESLLNPSFVACARTCDTWS